MKKDAKFGDALFGWDQFDLSSVVAPQPKARAISTTASARPKRKAVPAPSLEEQWDAFMRKCVGTDAAQAPEWIKLAQALRQLEPSSLHGRRYLDPSADAKKGTCWVREDGGWPRKNIDWKYRPGSRGGGNAGQGGPIFVRKTFLKAVYAYKYARK